MIAFGKACGVLAVWGVVALLAECVGEMNIPLYGKLLAGGALAVIAHNLARAVLYAE